MLLYMRKEGREGGRKEVKKGGRKEDRGKERGKEGGWAGRREKIKFLKKLYMLRILRYEDIPVLSEWALDAILYIFINGGQREI